MWVVHHVRKIGIYSFLFAQMRQLNLFCSVQRYIFGSLLKPKSKNKSYSYEIILLNTIKFRFAFQCFIDLSKYLISFQSRYIYQKY